MIFQRKQRLFLDITWFSNKSVISCHIYNFIKNEQERLLKELSIYLSISLNISEILYLVIYDFHAKEWIVLSCSFGVM